MPKLFLGLAKVETFLRDRKRLDQAIRSGDIEKIQDAWDKFYRWTDCISPND